MKKNLVLTLIFLAAGCSAHKTRLDREEQRRAKLEMQSVMEMMYSKRIPPVEFEFNSARLLESSYSLLDKIAAILVNHRSVKLVISGHTDDVGSERYNKKLSLERARAVKSYLVSKGVYPPSVRVYGYGESRPLVRETTERARALNRRVEFRLTTRNWETVY